MTKSNIKSINPADFLKAGKNREAIIENSNTNPVPPLGSYKANKLAAELHPAVQHLVVSKIEDQPDAKSFHLVANINKGTEKLAYFSAGQYLCVFVEIGGNTYSRPYSISSSPKQSVNGEYVITVKRVTGGLVTAYILDNWDTGTEVDVSAPCGTFTYEPLRDAKHIVGVAGGSGVTPFLSLAQAIADGDENAKLTLIYGAKNERELMFKDTFDKLSKTCDDFNVVYALSDEENEKYEHGFITAELIKKYAPDNYSLFICGPQAMYDFLETQIPALGLRRKFVRRELFGEYRNPQKNADYPQYVLPECKITVIIRDETTEITASTNDTILSSLEKNGIIAPARCRSGVCGWCHSKLVSGSVYVPKSVDGRRLADYDYGYIHPCCTFPLSDVTIIVPSAK